MTFGLTTIVVLAFLIAIFLFAIGAFLILYHLIRFGIGTEPKAFAFYFLIGSLVLFFLSTLTLVIAIPSLQAYDHKINNLTTK
jgi:hypothetical protein